MTVTSYQKFLLSSLIVALLVSGCGWIRWRSSEPGRDASTIDSAGADVTFASDQKKERDDATKKAAADGAQTGPGAGGATAMPMPEAGSDKSSGAGAAAGATDGGANGAKASPMKDAAAEADAAGDNTRGSGAGESTAKDAQMTEKVTLQGDALFQFGKADEKSMLPGGKQRLDELADKIIAMEKDTIAGITIVGHADRLGSPTGNMKTSEKRAATVMNYLIRRGVDAAILESMGKGDADPITDCPGGKANKALIACLSPNRRVEVMINAK